VAALDQEDQCGKAVFLRKIWIMADIYSSIFLKKGHTYSKGFMIFRSRAVIMENPLPFAEKPSSH
jgi:hypothetical protein